MFQRGDFSFFQNSWELFHWENCRGRIRASKASCLCTHSTKPTLKALKCISDNKADCQRGWMSQKYTLLPLWELSTRMSWSKVCIIATMEIVNEDEWVKSTHCCHVGIVNKDEWVKSTNYCHNGNCQRGWMGQKYSVQLRVLRTVVPKRLTGRLISNQRLK